MFIRNLVQKPKISLIVTYFNLGKYINQCILSILNQEWENFEIIIVNDCSDKENTSALKKFYNNKRIKIINLKQNLGQLGAFIEGLKSASGEFICMIDADDVLLPNYLKTLAYVHLSVNCAFVSSACAQINENDEVISFNYVNNPISKKINKINYKEIENMFKQNDEFEVKKVKAPFAYWSWNPSTSAMFRKEALQILKYFPDVSYWKTGADKVIFSLLDLIGGSINISAVCYLYRQHSANSSGASKPSGDKKYLNEEYIEKLIDWNKKIRIDTLKMFIKNRKNLVKKYNKINYIKMLSHVIFCIDIKICAKMFKTFAHKIIHI